MNVYDLAHNLARAIKENEYYKEFARAKKLIDGDAEAKKILTDFRNRQMEVEKARLLGQKPPADKMEALHKMQEIITANQKIKSYLEAEFKFGRLMADIQKIIGEGLDLFEKNA
ncbi:hypothetical protein Tfer_3197 [Thermincola ferriacetica]|uniref:UPF0342 protein Tfer_3197 n=1 Tax=Thermincola ferriacetica TaxID=281456 RepID=A0A0L6VYI3_9FIRM|nr:YlbF family regulator [Thermincola ferriacetica]KNZ68271.1 hypothetical protein Tfer_3197 [Thermincola ferriacetica]